MQRIGLTGGIGCGKTLVNRVFSFLNVPVFEADEVGRELLDKDPQTIEKVTRLLGRGVYRTGTLDRKTVSELVFKKKEVLKRLNEIIHPAVFREFQKWSQSQTGSPYLIMEAAIIFESGADAYLDAVICISAPEDLRILRVVNRDGVEPALVRDRINNQMTEKEILKRSDHVIINDDRTLVLPQILTIHKKLMSEAAIDK